MNDSTDLETPTTIKSVAKEIRANCYCAGAMSDTHKLSTFSEADLTDDWEVTVCDHCHQASCWLGLIMCYDAQSAGTRVLTVKRLRELNREHPSYWAAEARARVGVP